jgi:hypothetical protein
MPISPQDDLNYERFRQLQMRLDLSRGKPAPEQLDLSQALLDNAAQVGFRARDGFDCRNYGLLPGLPEARELGGELLGVPAAQVVAAGNSSLELMHDALAFALLHGVPQGEDGRRSAPWRAQGEIAFICPAPGYDRHFAMCEALGVRMIAVLMFASLSKVTIAGGALAWLAASPGNVAWWQRCASARTIGPDKLNQLRHVHYLRERATLDTLMARHRALLAPKFAAVDEVLRERLSGIPGVRWNVPQGGYFISLYVPPGHARRTVELAGAAGLVLTPAGAAFPYGVDPLDSHLRIAPSFASLDEVRLAAQGIAVSLLRSLETSEALVG